MTSKKSLELVRPIWGFSNDASILYQFIDDKPLKAHDDYVEAKSGSPTASVRLVCKLVDLPAIETAKSKFVEFADCLLPIVAVEMQGNNVIPLALAAYYSYALGLELNTSVYQSNRAYHTGADPMERLLARVEFDGEVEDGKRYVLVDDVSTMGSTLADCAAYIAINGGEVVGAILLTNSSQNKSEFKAHRKYIQIIKERYDETIRELFSIAPNALTYDEARYLSNFKTADQIRGRAVKARNETQRRIFSKRISEA